jgi:hypothetical protein
MRDNSVGAVQSYPGKHNFSVKEQKGDVAKYSLKCASVCWLVGQADPRKVAVVRELDCGGGCEAGIPRAKTAFSSATLAVMTSARFQASDGLQRVERFDGEQAVNPMVRL